MKYSKRAIFLLFSFIFLLTIFLLSISEERLSLQENSSAQIYSSYSTSDKCGRIYNNTVLNKSVVSSSNTCFIISAPNIIFDCMNNEITILITNKSGIHSGIYIDELAHNTTIKNCRISGFNIGLLGDIYGTYSWSANNSFLDNVINIKNYGLRARGIYILDGEKSKIINNTIFVLGNRTYGIRFEGKNFDVLVSKNYIEGEVIPGGLFITPLETSQHVTSSSINNNHIICRSHPKGLGALFIAETTNSSFKNNLIESDFCNGIQIKRSSNNSIVNNTIILNKGKEFGVGILDHEGENLFLDNIIINYTNLISHFGGKESIYKNTRILNENNELLLKNLALIGVKNVSLDENQILIT